MRFSISNTADMVPSRRLSNRSSGVTGKKAPIEATPSLGGAAAASSRKNATSSGLGSSSKPRRSSDTKKERSRKDFGSTMKSMDPNDIIKMLEIQAQTDSAYGLHSLQALKNLSPESTKRTSKRSSNKGLPRRTKSLEADADLKLNYLPSNVDMTKPRRNSKQKIRRTKSMDGAQGIPSSIDVGATKPRRGRRKTLAEQLSPSIDEDALERSWSRISVGDL